MNILCLKNHPEEGPARIADWAQERGVDLEIVEASDIATISLSGYDALLVMGGPMSVHDRSEVTSVAAILEVVEKAWKSGMPVLGICLGAQMLAIAAGGQVVSGPEKEIGWYPVSVFPKGRELLGADRGTAMVFHWHGEQIVASEGSDVWASTPICPAQALPFGPRQWGVQFHLEVDETSLEGMLSAFQAEVAQGGPGVSSPEEMRRGFMEHGESCRQHLYALLDAWVTG
jgi:GMP synthase-like glutamine amidotransferase